ncbi:hypothetical protein [Ottowia thiooxydans]|uniref:hypothetical protein n=1 Tax=Ottowia thiooxydans TaxID=219182 RepID=UPI000686F572|nr:hypothetical protein [Ottowia thiooxydans]
MMLRTTLCLALAALATGCATQSSTPLTVQGCPTWAHQLAAGNPWPNAQVLSPELAQVIGVREVLTSRTGTGMAAVQASVYNCTDVDVVLSMRTRFTGERGQSEPPSSWKTVHLPPRSQAAYGESAVSQATRGVAVEIYDANRGQSQFAPGQSYAVPMPGGPLR